MVAAPLLGGRQPGRRRELATAAGLAGVLVVVALAASPGPQTGLLQLGGGQILVIGEAYPYVGTPYSDSYRPYGYQSPAQYPVYPYENGQSYGNVRPYYEAYGKNEGKTYHEWFPDDYNTGTGPLSPLWTAMAGKQRRVQQEAALHIGFGPGLSRAVTTTLNAVDHAPTRAVEGGQYYSPVLPSEDESPAWNLFGDNWADHTYEPSVNPRSRSPVGNGAKLLHSQLRAAAPNMAALGDDRGFQQLAHSDWRTRGHSNNYMGMEAPVHNANALGDHQVGFTDREYNASVVDAEEQNHVVDNALRSMWDVFAGNEDVTSFEAPKMGFSLDNHVLCEEEDDPALCAEHPAVGRPVSGMLCVDMRTYGPREKEQARYVPFKGRVRSKELAHGKAIANDVGDASVACFESLAWNSCRGAHQSAVDPVSDECASGRRSASNWRAGPGTWGAPGGRRFADLPWTAW